MKKEFGWELGSQVGTVEDIDTGSTKDCLGKYMRVKVRIDVTKPLERALNFVLDDEDKTICIFISYEKLPEFCYHYGLIGHSQSECRDYKKSSESVTDLEPNFGKHLRATYRNRPRRNSFPAIWRWPSRFN